MSDGSIRPLQIAVAIAAVVPVGAGLAGVLAGPAFVNDTAGADADSHFRYLSGLLLGIGLCYWATIPDIARLRMPFRLLTTIVVVGGVGRLLSLFVVGVPSPEMVAALGMELGVAPSLALWRERLDAHGKKTYAIRSNQEQGRGIAP